MSNIKEEIHVVGNTNDVLIEVTDQYVTKSVTVKNSSNVIYSINEIGDKFIEIITPLTQGEVLTIIYQTLTDFSVDKLQIKVTEYKKEVEELKKELSVLKESLDNRISINTFNAWKRLIEDKLGISLNDSVYNVYESKQLYKKSGS